MLIDFYQERGTAIATPLCPRLDAVKAPAFRNAAAAIAQQQLEEDVVVIDLDHVSYLDMSGMWALLCFGQMIDASREVRLCNL
ncbi:MAG: STAS domain-containing protein, partial [Pseudomonadota bacterium]